MIIGFLCIVLFGWTILIEITTRSARRTSKLKKKTSWRKMGFRLVTSEGQRKNSESP